MTFRLKWPTEFNGLTQQFGARPEVYKSFGLPGHEGLDFSAPTGSKVFACAAGTVSEVRLQGNLDRKKFPYGNQVRIHHITPDGEFFTIYAHLESARVAAGAVVEAGTWIGIADSTGNSEGAHLHLTLKKVGATAAGLTAYPNDIIDPTPFLDAFDAEHILPAVQVNDLSFQADITIPDFSIKAGGEQFVKTWKVKNTGTTAWGAGYSLTFFKDEQMGAANSVPLPALQPGASASISVTLTTPGAPGIHRSTWKAKSPTGELFGNILFALIRVPASADDQPVNAMIDLSHHNTVNDLMAAKADGIAAIIHKATQGTGFVDARYAERSQQAKQLGLLWGAYHFGEGGDPIAQAEHFLQTVQPDARTILALDLERNPFGDSMSVAQAEKFVQHIHDKTGNWPLIYSGLWYLREFIGDNDATLLSNCPLWIAAYVDRPNLPMQWANWTFWQYTNGVDGPNPHAVAGIQRCDRSQFNGTLAELKQLWNAA